MTSSRRLPLAALTVFASAVLLIAGCARADKPADLSLDKGAAVKNASSSANSTSTPAAETTGSTGRTPIPPKGSASNGSTSGSTSSGTSSSSGGKKIVPPPANATSKVRILWWNDTADKKPVNWEVRIGSATFKPGSGKSGTGLIGPVAIGKKLEIVVYPDGPNGKKVTVPLAFDAKMQPETERDGIHVAVSDTEVRVVGNAVANFDVIAPRF